VLSTLGLRIRVGLTRFVAKAKRLLHEAIRPLPIVAGVVSDSEFRRVRISSLAVATTLVQQNEGYAGAVKRVVFQIDNHL
jgi:hypothetical protein